MNYTITNGDHRAPFLFAGSLEPGGTLILRECRQKWAVRRPDFAAPKTPKKKTFLSKRGQNPLFVSSAIST